MLTVEAANHNGERAVVGVDFDLHHSRHDKIGTTARATLRGRQSHRPVSCSTLVIFEDTIHGDTLYFQWTVINKIWISRHLNYVPALPKPKFCDTPWSPKVVAPVRTKCLPWPTRLRQRTRPNYMWTKRSQSLQSVYAEHSANLDAHHYTLCRSGTICGRAGNCACTNPALAQFSRVAFRIVYYACSLRNF